MRKKKVNNHFKGIRFYISTSIVSLVLVSAFLNTCLAEIKLPAVISNNMVLQQDDEAAIWGWAEPNEEISIKVTWDKKVSYKAVASKDGRWKTVLQTPKAKDAASKKAYKILVHGDKSKNKIKVKNVLIGEVWICSGQSNMEFPVGRRERWKRGVINYKKEIAAADYPKIRMFTVKRNSEKQPQSDCVGDWKVCSPDTVGDFSAVGYYFGRELHEELDVPVGMINASVGGTPAESWTRREILEAEADFAPIIERTKDLDNRNAASGLYNGMIAPLIPYGIRGAIWYQGEANTRRAYQYRTLFPAMVKNWRCDWERGDFPFYFVQLANFQDTDHEPFQSTWAELREAQSMTLSLVNTGMAVTIDIGNPKDIHPRNKKDVGRRLALWALAHDYGKKLVYSGPVYKSMRIEGDKIILHFDHIDGGLVSKDSEPLKGFAIAGEDRKLVCVDAKIKGDTVVVRSGKVSEPVAVRYGWADSPECNLFNKEGLPASPFRTDYWPGVTDDKK